MKTRHRLAGVAGLLALVLVLVGCPKPMDQPGDTSAVTLIATTTQNGWVYETYRNTAYPCSISGYQTFTVGTRVGQAPTVAKPLWVYLHGGGVGYFSPDGTPQPSAGQKTEENPATQVSNLTKGLNAQIRSQTVGYRMLAVSMCNHDIYSGADIPDPNNPNTTPDGEPRTVNGLFATKAAIQYVLDRYPTGDHFLYGTSAGGFGSYSVGWALERQGIPATGIVADSGVLNVAWQYAVKDDPVCGRGGEAEVELPRRLHPDVMAEGNNPDQLVADGRLTTPVLDVFSIGDPGQCGTKPIACPRRDGSTVTMGAVECMHEPMRAAIDAQGAASRSLSLRLCVDPASAPGSGTCATHTPTAKPGLVNSDPAWPADYNAVVLDWVADRRADD